MKIPFPLSLKVSLWLLLNIALLAVVGGGFFIKEAGFTWDAFVTGSSGERLQAVANNITATLATTPLPGRDEVLARESAAWGVTFYLFGGDGRQIAGPRVELPEPVRARLAGPGGPRGGFGGGPGGNQRDGFGNGPRGGGGGARGGGNQRGGGPNFGPAQAPPPSNPAPTPPRAQSPAASGVFAAVATPAAAPPAAGPGFAAQPARSPSDNGQPRGRFLVPVGDPTAYWAGVRLSPIPDGGGGAMFGATLLMRADSLGGTALLLDLKPWLVAATAAMGLSVLFWLPLVRGITRSLGQLTRATEEIAEGRFDTRVDEGRRDEIGRLGGAVNVMAAQLDRAASGQKRFLGDIAHELGSPVGRMQVAVGILEERVGPALQPAVADVREEVQQMSELVGELLAFTKAGLRARDAALARVELAPLVADVLAREAAAGKVFVSVPAGLAVEADAALLARALANLVRNALRYAGHAGPVALTARADGDEVVIAVEDSGPGVPPETLERLGEPFYRPEFARTRETGGAGLGLAIVKSAVEACRGTVRFSNREPRGFRAELRLAAA